MIVVPHQPPAPWTNFDHLGDGRVHRVHLEATGQRRTQRHTQHCIYDSPVATHHNGLSFIVSNSAMKRDTDAVMEFSDSLTTWKRHSMRVALPVGHSVPLDEVCI